MLQTNRRQGTVVAQRVEPDVADAAAEQLRVAAAGYVTAARTLGFGEEAAIAAIKAYFTD